jgi:hypothetical protein
MDGALSSDVEGEMEELGIVAEGKEVMEIKKRYGRLVPVDPDIILLLSSGHFCKRLLDLGRAKLHDFVHTLKVAGRASMVRANPHIFRVIYEIRVGELKTVRALNTLLEFLHEHSFGKLSTGLERGKAIADMVIEELRKAPSASLGTPTGKYFVIQTSSLGASSLGVACRVGERLKKEVPEGFFFDVIQLSSLPGIPKEEVGERISLAQQMVTHRVTNNIKAIIHYPYVSSMREGEVRHGEVFDICLHEALEFFIDLVAYYVVSIKLGREGLLEELDEELDKTYAGRHIFLLSSVHYAPTTLEGVKWMAPLQVVRQFIGEIEKRGYIFGIFATRTKMESVKKALGRGTIPATGVISPRGENKWIVCLEVEEKEVEELLTSCVASTPIESLSSPSLNSSVTARQVEADEEQ